MLIGSGGALFAITTPKADIEAVPEKSGGVYYAYPVTTDSLPPIPEGFEPVYLSHYGRHGSRWVINKEIHNMLVNQLSEQKSEGNLTPEGERTLEAVKRLQAHTKGHWGELSPLGERQHKGIADRMMKRFPTLFKGNTKVIARSSVEPRCIISMAAFSEQLKEGNGALDIERHATPSDMEFISYATPQASAVGKEKAPWRKEFNPVKDSLTRAETTAAKIFKNPENVSKLPEVMRNLHDVAIAVQDVDGADEDLLGLFTPEDMYNQWQNTNYFMYVRHGNSKEGAGLGPQCARNLLRDLVEKADEALAGKRPSVDLRFGHDTALVRLLSLMGVEGADLSQINYKGDIRNRIKEVSANWQSYKLTPMAANLQLLFIRNKSGEVLVSVRLNEQPVKINGAKEAKNAPGYYPWNELRRLWLSTVNPVASLLERVSPGSSKRFILQEIPSDENFFEISTIDGKPAISANNTVNLAAGLNWYLKYYPHIHLSWNNMKADLPEVLPLPAKPERHTTDALQRYYLNYCTHSYSMPFWDEERWQQEIDWMALHGINMPLMIAGVDEVWRNTLMRLGYSKKEAEEFVAGPAFQAWWLMNNLEGWGGPNTENWYKDRVKLAKSTIKAMEEYGMTPVLPGYSGMVPHDADERLGLDVSGKGIWNGFVRPAFLNSTDPKFNLIADIYYDELTKLYGPAKYYSMDPFHEGGSTEGVNLTEAGAIIAGAMKRANPEAVWVIQGWNENPRKALLDGVKKGDIVVLDLASEIKPQWGDPDSPSKTPRETGYDPHDWMWCMLLNFGGNVGLHGRLDNVIGGYYKAKNSKYGKDMTGFGLTPEGIENNPMMYELVPELIWREKEFDKNDWLAGYTEARYGKADKDINKAWKELGATIYNCPWGNLQQGTTESVFCARPSDKVWKVSSWSRLVPYYKPEDVIHAAKIFGKAADKFKDNANYRYDLVDITRQAVAEKGRLVYTKMQEALKKNDMKTFRERGEELLQLIKEQDLLLSTMPDFTVTKWIEDARNLGHDDAEKDNMERNARLLITTWGPRVASEEGGLRDYAHREWSGVLGDLYYTRWKTWIDHRAAGKEDNIDFYPIDETWVNKRGTYPTRPESEAVATALNILKTL